MFAIFIYEREPLHWSDLLSAFLTWVADAGGFAAVALLIWGLAHLARRSRNDENDWSLTQILFATAYVLGLLAYGLFFLLVFFQGTLPDQAVNSYGKTKETWKLMDGQKICLQVGGAFALLAVLIPILANLPRLRVRRIWAIAKLSIKETIRHRVLWVFAFLILIVLFASWFVDSDKPEFQLSHYIYVLDWSLTILLLLAASLLAAFSIPSDVRSQTIHTVVTKPVERFEIVLGRFFGYTILMSAVLAVATGLGLLYMFRNINEEARRETYKARVPIYGLMHFKNTEGINAGREWTHRKYITSPRHREKTPPQYAIWSFNQVPEYFADRPDGVNCEFSFDIYRTHKGEQGKGIFCQFLVVTSQVNLIHDANNFLVPENKKAIDDLKTELEKEHKSSRAVRNELAEKFGYFEPPPKEVTDYHTQAVTLPAGLFHNLQIRAGKDAADASDEAGNRAPLRVIVNVTEKSPAQLVGVSPIDLYLLDQERPFAGNYLKASLGLWYRLALVIGLAVAVSTYLSGIITWIVTMVLFLLGLFREDIGQLASGLSEGGGPWESTIRVFSRKATAADLEPNTLSKVATIFDQGFEFVLGLIMKMIPDVNRFDLSRYLSSGFDISWSNVLLLDTLLPMLGYLLPCLIFAFYLIKYREVANPA